VGGTDVLYISRQDDEVGGTDMFRCFLLHVSAIYLEVHKQDNECVKRNRNCTLLVAFIPFLLCGLQECHLILLH